LQTGESTDIVHMAEEISGIGKKSDDFSFPIDHICGWRTGTVPKPALE